MAVQYTALIKRRKKKARAFRSCFRCKQTTELPAPLVKGFKSRFLSFFSFKEIETMANSSITYDLCIIGAGMFGSAAARHATASLKSKACLIGPEEPTKEEWDKRMIFSSHYDEGRIISKDPSNEYLNILFEESVHKIHDLEEDSGKKLFNKTGCLYLYNYDDENALKILNEIKSGESQYLDISSNSMLSKKSTMIIMSSGNFSCVCSIIIFIIIITMPTADIYFERCDEQPYLYGAYILPPIKYPDGQYYLKIGHKGSIVNSELNSLPEIKNWYNSKGDHYVYEHYPKILQDLIPGLKFEEIISKTCVTCSNPSELPYIDNISPNVTVAAVGNGAGVMMCEEIGYVAAKLSVEATWNSKLSKSLFKTNFCDA